MWPHAFALAVSFDSLKALSADQNVITAVSTLVVVSSVYTIYFRRLLTSASVGAGGARKPIVVSASIVPSDNWKKTLHILLSGPVIRPTPFQIGNGEPDTDRTDIV